MRTIADSVKTCGNGRSRIQAIPRCPEDDRPLYAWFSRMRIGCPNDARLVGDLRDSQRDLIEGSYDAPNPRDTRFCAGSQKDRLGNVRLRSHCPVDPRDIDVELNSLRTVPRSK